MYLSCGTHPDIAFVVGQLSCHNSNPQIRYLCIVKQVLRYLKETITLGIKWKNNFADHRLGRKYRELGVVRYADSSYAGNLEDKKSIIGYCFFFSRVIIIWCNKRQRTISISISEAKYVAVSQGTREEIWIQQILNELLSEDMIREMKMLDNNETSLTLTKDLESQNQTKHIDIIHYPVRRLMKDGELAIEQIESSTMLVDGLIKALLIGLFKKH